LVTAFSIGIVLTSSLSLFVLTFVNNTLSSIQVSLPLSLVQSANGQEENDEETGDVEDEDEGDEEANNNEDENEDGDDDNRQTNSIDV
jgi:hypothetical protein